MSSQIDQRVVAMRFDNDQFERQAQTTMNTLAQLENSLQLNGAAKGLSSLQTGVDAVSFAKMQASIDQIAGHFSIWGRAVDHVIGGIGRKIESFASNTFNKLTVEPITSGFSEYEEKMGSVQTIMASSKADLATVNRYLAELNEYSDKTIYSFKDMTSSIGKFTNAGVDLDTAVKAIQGISNEAAISGANANEASRAMYNFAQALSTGSVKLIDWKSIENANMATVEFKEQLLQTAEACGTVRKNSDGMYEVLTTGGTGGKMKEAISATAKFNDSLSYQWMTAEVLTKTLTKYADETTDLGQRATAAATEVKTWSQLFDTLQEAVGSGWSETYEIIFGDFEQAKELWTGINNAVSDIIGKVSDARNNLLREAFGTRSNVFSSDSFRDLVSETDFLHGLKDGLAEAGVKTKSLADANNKLEDALTAFARNSGVDIDGLIKEYGSLFDSLDNGWLTAEMLRDGLKDLADAGSDTGKTLEELSKIADEVISGKFGNGLDRVNALTEAGYNAADVQSIVNNKLLGTEISIENLSDATLKSKGYTEEQIKVLRTLQKQSEDTGTPLGLLIDKMTRPTARTLILETIANLYKTLIGLARPVGEAMEAVFGKFDSERLYQSIKAVHDYTAGMVTSVSNLTDPIRNIFTLVFKVGSTILGLIGTIIGFGLRSVGTLLGTIAKILFTLAQDVTNVVNAISKAISPVVKFFQNDIFGPIKSSSKDAVKLLGNGLYKAFLKVRGGIIKLHKAFSPVIRILKIFAAESAPIIKSKLVDAFTRIRDVLKGLKDTFVNTIGGFVDFNSIIELISPAIHQLRLRLDNIMGSGASFKERLIAIKDAFLDFFKKVGDKLSKNFSLGKVFEFLKDKVEKVKEAFQKLTGIDIGGLFGKVKQKITDVFGGITSQPIFSDFFGTISSEIEKIKSNGALEWLREKLDDIKQGIKDFFTSTDGSDLSILDRLRVLFEPVQIFMSNTFDNSSVLAHNVTSAFTIIIQNIKNALDQFDPAVLKAIVLVGLGCYLISNAMVTLASLKSTITNAGTVVKTLKSILSNINGLLVAKKKELSVTRFGIVAVGILAIAAALYMLSKVDAEQLGTAAVALFIGLGAVALVLTALGKMNSSKASLVAATSAAETAATAAEGVEKLRNQLVAIGQSFADAASELTKGIRFAATIISFVIAIGFVAFTIVQISKNYTIDDLMDGILIVAMIGAGLYGVMQGMGRLRGMTMGDALSFISMALALKLIADVIMQMSEFATGENAAGLGAAVVAVGAILITLGILVAVIQRFAKDAKKLAAAGATMLLMAISIRLLVEPLKALGKLPQDQLMQGGLALAGIAFGLAIVLKVISTMSGNAASISAIIGSFVGAIMLITGALFVLSNFTNTDQLISSVIALASVIAVFTVAMIALAQFAPQIAVLGAGFSSMGIGLLACAGAFLVFVGAIALLGVTLPLIATGLVKFSQIIVDNAPVLIRGIVALAMIIATALVTIAPIIASAGLQAIVAIFSTLYVIVMAIGPEKIAAAISAIWSIIVKYGGMLLQFLWGFIKGLFAGIMGAIGDGFLNMLNGLDEVVANGVKWFAERLPLGLGDGLVSWANGVLEGVDEFRADMNKKSKEIEEDDFVSAEDFDKSAEVTSGLDKTKEAVTTGTQGVTDAYKEGFADLTVINDEEIGEKLDLTDIVTQAGSGNLVAFGDFSSTLQTGLQDNLGGVGDYFGEGGINLEGVLNENLDLSGVVTDLSNGNIDSFVTNTDRTVEAENAYGDAVVGAVQDNKAKIAAETELSGEESIAGWGKGFQSKLDSTKETVGKTLQSFVDHGNAVLGISSPSRVFMDMGRYSAEGYGEGIRAAGPAAQRQVTELLKGALDRISQQNSKWRTAATMAAGQFSSGLRSKSQEAKRAGTQIASAAKTGVGSIQPYQWETVGQQLVAGLIRGINSKAKAARNAAANVATQALNKLKSVPQISSPSKVTTRYGEYFGQGWVNGITSMTRVSEVAASNLAEDSISAMQETVKKINDLMLEPLELDPTIRPVLDLTDVQNGAAQLGGMLSMRAPVQVGGFLNQNDIMSEMVDVLRLDMRNRRLAAASGGGTTYNITVNAPTGNARDIAREIERIIVRR